MTVQERTESGVMQCSVFSVFFELPLATQAPAQSEQSHEDRRLLCQRSVCLVK